MRYLVGTLCALLATPGAHAKGLAVKDLTAVETPITAALGSNCAAQAEPQRVVVTCPDDAGAPIVSIQLGRQSDGTEERVRSGVTKIADLERACRAKSPECTLTALDVAPAVGWVTAYPLGPGAGATVVLLQDGDIVTVRSIAEDAAAARKSIDLLLPVLRTHVVGR